MSAEDFGCVEHIAEDGIRVWFDAETDEPVAAVDAAGQETDPGAYALDYGDDYAGDDIGGYVDHGAGLREAWDARSEQRAEAMDRVNADQMADRFEREREMLEQELGRPLSDRELHSVLTDYSADYHAGLEPSLWKSASTVDIPTGGDHASRVARALDSIADSERRETGEVYDPDARPWHEPASSSPSDVRVARAMNFHDHGVSSARAGRDHQRLRGVRGMTLAQAKTACTTGRTDWRYEVAGLTSCVSATARRRRRRW